jgi:hypothetical protein
MCGNIGVLIVDIIGFATQSLNSINICEINLELQIKVFTLHFFIDLALIEILLTHSCLQLCLHISNKSRGLDLETCWN